MPLANLYLDKVDLSGYLNKNCAQCGFQSCSEFISALKNGTKIPRDCPFLSRNEAYAFEAALKMPSLLPGVPMLIHPRPAFTGLMELNEPDSNSLVLVSGNNEYTEQILMTVLGTTTAPFFVIFVDTDGNTVDMSMVFKTLTAERVHKALKEAGIECRSSRREMIIPGLASSIKDDIERLTGWRVRVGPACAAGLPIFLSEIWTPPEV